MFDNAMLKDIAAKKMMTPAISKSRLMPANRGRAQHSEQTGHRALLRHRPGRCPRADEAAGAYRGATTVRLAPAPLSIPTDLAPKLAPFIRSVCSGYAPVWGLL
jgi:hypothetical protein